VTRDWTQLAASDFKLKNPDWAPDRPCAEVDFEGRKVELTVSARVDVQDTHVALFKLVLSGWNEHRADFANQTEEYLQNFLPGRRVSPEELVISLASIKLDHDGDHRPCGISIWYSVAGEYGSSEYDLMQFNSDCSIELNAPIESGRVVWSELDICVLDI
jgi:hypothetical protein